MIVDRYDPIYLFAMVPKLKLQFEPELAGLDELLDDDELFLLVKADLVKRYPNSARLGRHSTPVDLPAPRAVGKAGLVAAHPSSFGRRIPAGAGDEKA